MNSLVCPCGSFVEHSSAFRSLSGDNLALASHPRISPIPHCAVSAQYVYDSMNVLYLLGIYVIIVAKKVKLS